MKLFENLKKEIKQIMEWRKYGLNTQIALATLFVLIALLLITGCSSSKVYADELTVEAVEKVTVEKAKEEAKEGPVLKDVEGSVPKLTLVEPNSETPQRVSVRYSAP